MAEVVAMITGVPTKRIAQSEGIRLLKMSEELKGRVIGQDNAIQKLAKAIQRTRAGHCDPKHPVRVHVFRQGHCNLRFCFIQQIPNCRYRIRCR